jgi:kynurenine formamidase
MMRRIILAATIAASFGFTTLAAAQAPEWQMPPDNQRCPSKWGAGDPRGSSNLQKPEMVMKAARLIKTGQVFELAAVLSPDPKESFINDNRQYNIYTKPSLPVANERTENEELIITELGQIGTQLDAFAHQMWGDSFYNCFKQADIYTRYGYKKLGVENVGQLMTRGVLIDVAGLKAVDMLAGGYIITPTDLQEALAREHMSLQPGDAVIINTGYGRLMGKDNDRYGKSTPGIGIAAALWLVQQNPMIVGTDTCCVEVRPSQKGYSLPVHSIMLIQYGVHLLENLLLEQLAGAGAYEFAFLMQPLKLKGATGAAVATTAIR